MSCVQIRNLKIDEGIPKICIPLVGTNKKDLLNEVVNIKNLDPDLVEWRIDWFDQAENIESVVNMAQELNEALGSDVALLCTFRTLEEGGRRAINTQDYLALNKAVIDSEAADIVDVELFKDDYVLEELATYAKNSKTKIIASNHDFDKTPAREELVSRLERMQELGADILKIAVMPQSKHDVIELLAATEEVSSKPNSAPIVTMSMGAMGSISRMCGEVFGSAITFGCASQASAPGQIDVADLRSLLTLIHKNL